MTIVSSNRWAKSSEDGTHRLLRIIHNNSIRGTNSAIKTSIDGLYLGHGTEFSVL
ncbi:hypothetical protein NC652_038183 [Populus alba x Populus x berolinensis]|uniref:Transposase n=1 Tax=Populus alba x Populus x berolinensis TaxID=444605 RepID=A0AAD6LGD5_9ROSI|nr:hypothetical protein NC651_037003 [Populus alba x Populus x berolinensis]KAJ6866862.1 hypothetical protein NC652_038183 [Populus alba x Populus x berolinensis]KAJ6960050.1 hypothetical protein NC653_038180 [Populus alba x Populus x berolinensis]